MTSPRDAGHCTVGGGVSNENESVADADDGDDGEAYLVAVYDAKSLNIPFVIFIFSCLCWTG